MALYPWKAVAIRTGDGLSVRLVLIFRHFVEEVVGCVVGEGGVDGGRGWVKVRRLLFETCVA